MSCAAAACGAMLGHMHCPPCRKGAALVGLCCLSLHPVCSVLLSVLLGSMCSALPLLLGAVLCAMHAFLVLPSSCGSDPVGSVLYPLSSGAALCELYSSFCGLYFLSLH